MALGLKWGASPNEQRAPRVDSGTERRVGDILNEAKMYQRSEVSAGRASGVVAKRKEDGLVLMRLESGSGPNPGDCSHQLGD